MKILEFIEKYCKDITDTYKNNSKLVDWTCLPYTDIEEDEEGAKIPVVYIDAQAIHVRDFVEMEKDEFVTVHNTPNAGEAYDNYISGLEIIEGPELVEHYRNLARQEVDKLNKFSASDYDSVMYG